MKLKKYIYCLHHEDHYIFNPDDEDKKPLSTEEDLVYLFNMTISILTTYNFKRCLWMLWCDMLL